MEVPLAPALKADGPPLANAPNPDGFPKADPVAGVDPNAELAPVSDDGPGWPRAWL